jgi:hypothetical protein
VRSWLSTIVALNAVGVAGCGGSIGAPDDGGGTSIDATWSTVPDAGAPDGSMELWWQPRPGQYFDWDWQLGEPYDIAAARSVYALDLFDVVPEGSFLQYEKDTIEVPAGPLAGAIEMLHARTPRPIVICRVATGAWEAERPDAFLFPGAAESPPDRPEPPAKGSVIGWSTGRGSERWLDIRPASRAAFAPLIGARLDFARRIGCDAIEADRNDPVGRDPGFPIEAEDQLSWFEEVAAEAHARLLSVGMKNGHDLDGASARLAAAFDWALPERCAELEVCDRLQPFLDARKAVFAVDYQKRDKGGIDPDLACQRQIDAGIVDGLVKDDPPTGRFRRQCRR